MVPLILIVGRPVEYKLLAITASIVVNSLEYVPDPTPVPMYNETRTVVVSIDALKITPASYEMM
jgi:hypothetical protein